MDDHPEVEMEWKDDAVTSRDDLVASPKREKKKKGGKKRKVEVVETAVGGNSHSTTVELAPVPPERAILRIEDFQSKKHDPNDVAWKKMGKGLREFYISQNLEIDGFQEVELLLGDSPPPSQAAADKRNEKLVIYLSFGVNVMLLISLILAVAFSGAISIIASVIDSSLDLFSSLIIVATSRAKNKVNRYKYPQGKERLEPVGVLVFSAVMGTTSLMLIIEAVKKLISTPFEAPDLGWISIGFLLADIGIKLALFLFCRQFGKRVAAAKALAQDHRNDVVVNSVALISAYLGSSTWPPLDPVGAILIALWTMYNWGDSCLEQIRYLTGRAASPDFMKRLTWICFNHDPEVIAIDTVRAFHFGMRYLVEVDIVLAPETSLQAAHDIGEALQKKIETLEEVERAFVHLDFETSHHPSSEHKTWGDES